MVKLAGQERIRAFVEEREGKCSLRTVQRWIARAPEEHPLPVRRSPVDGSVVAESEQVIAWLDEEAQRKRLARASRTGKAA